MAGRIAGGLRCSRLSAAASVAAIVLAVGCGGSSHPHPSSHGRPQTGGGEQPAPQNLKPADPKRVAVVRDWADALRGGHVREASSYFALPAIIENAGPEYLLRNRQGVRGFNQSLPCGARVLRAVRVRRYTIVTFKLTDRHGNTPGCGNGKGRLAAVAFAFRRGKISEWRRVTVPPKEQQARVET